MDEKKLPTGEAAGRGRQAGGRLELTTCHGSVTFDLLEPLSRDDVIRLAKEIDELILNFSPADVQGDSSPAEKATKSPRLVAQAREARRGPGWAVRKLPTDIVSDPGGERKA